VSRALLTPPLRASAQPDWCAFGEDILAERKGLWWCLLVGRAVRCAAALVLCLVHFALPAFTLVNG
jgi:hypothetical protein